LRLNLGPGDNTVNVTEFNGDVLFSLFGNGGADTFNVTVRPSDLVTGGRLFINGGDGDVLNVLYATKPEVAKKPKVHHDQDPLTDSGTITVDYEDLGYLFQIDYVGVETVDIDKA
jgi:hypothetical protein